MLNLFEIEPVKTYKTKANAIKAVEKVYPDAFKFNENVRYIINIHTDGRFYPVFIGQMALTYGAHYHFNVIG